MLLLARIEQSLGELESSRSHYRSIVERPRRPAAHVALYVGFLIEHGPPDETRRWLKQLEERAADDVVTLGLRRSWLRAQGHGGDIETLVEEWAGRMLPPWTFPRRVQFAEGLANLYQRRAVRLCRALVSPDTGVPAGRLRAPRPGHRRPGRIPEALNVCAEAAKNDSSVRRGVRRPAPPGQGGRAGRHAALGTVAGQGPESAPGQRGVAEQRGERAHCSGQDGRSHRALPPNPAAASPTLYGA